MIVKDELSRYLPLTIDALLTFCDEVAVIDDYSSDGTYDYLLSRQRVVVRTNPAVTFDEHEGKARQALLDLVRECSPTHVLAIDADEFVNDGQMLRAQIAAVPKAPVWSLEMQEVWKADEERLWIRQDGGWRAHEVPILWRPGPEESWWRIRDRALACGREPEAVSELRVKARLSRVAILHFGWTNLTERQRRYDRYMAIDNGAFHASNHLRSIMWPERKIRLRSRTWPMSMERERVLSAVREVRG